GGGGGRGGALAEPRLQRRQRGPGRRRRHGIRGRRRGHAAEAPLDDQVEECLLALDVVVERAWRDAELAGDIGHLRAAVALGQEDLEGGLEDLVEPGAPRAVVPPGGGAPCCHAGHAAYLNGSFSQASAGDPMAGPPRRAGVQRSPQPRWRIDEFLALMFVALSVTGPIAHLASSLRASSPSARCSTMRTT